MSSLRRRLQRREPPPEDRRRSPRCRPPTASSGRRRRRVRDPRPSTVAASSAVCTRIVWLGRVTGGADHLVVAGVTDQQDRHVAPREPTRLAVHLGDQRARRVDHRESASPRVVVHRRVRRRAPRTRPPRPRGTSSSSSTNTAPLASRSRDDVPVVDDLPAHVHGRTERARAAPPCRWRARRRRSSRAARRGGSVSPGHGSWRDRLRGPRHEVSTRNLGLSAGCHFNDHSVASGPPIRAPASPSNPS